MRFLSLHLPGLILGSERIQMVRDCIAGGAGAIRSFFVLLETMLAFREMKNYHSCQTNPIHGLEGG